MEKIRVKLNIGGINYFITTDESAEYTAELGEKIDKRMAEIIHSNSLITGLQAAVLTSLELADELSKTSDNLQIAREQINTYLEDAAKAKAERDYYKRELERYKTEASFKNDQINLFAGAKQREENDKA